MTATAEHHCTGVVAHTALASSLLSCWHLWRVFIVVAMASSLSLLRWGYCRSCTSIVALIVLGLLPVSRCHCCIVALVSLPSLRWRHHRWRLCHHCASVFTIVAVAPSTLLHWHLHCWSTQALANTCCSGRGAMLLCWSWG